MVRRVALLMVGLLLTGELAGQVQTVPMEGTSLDVDLYGTVYIIDAPSATLRVLNADFTLAAVVGGPGWEEGRFDHPAAVWARNGLDIFVADYGNHRIQRFDRQLAFVSSLSTRESDNTDERFGYPRDVVLSPLGDLFVVDGENQRIVKIGGLSRVELTFGGFDAGRGKLNQPSRIAIGPSDRIYVLDEARILVYDIFGNFLTSLYEGMWKSPTALYADPERVLVVDDSKIFWFGSDEQLIGQLPLGGEPGSVASVRAIAHHKGKLILLDDHALVVLDDPFARRHGN
jgi:DNA-binding beta-propeller fold protein YncE